MAPYRTLAGKIRNITQLRKLQKADGTYTRTIQETMNHMMEYFVPNNSEADDSDYQSADTPINTLDDKEFSSGDKQYSGRNGSEEGARRRWYQLLYSEYSTYFRNLRS